MIILSGVCTSIAMDLAVDNPELQSPLLGYAGIGFPSMTSSFWATWMALVLTTLLSFWGLIGVKGFRFAFIWGGKRAQVRVMLQSSSDSNGSRERKAGSVFVSDESNNCRNISMDDLDVWAQKKQTVFDCKRIQSKSSSCTFDSLTYCNSSDSEFRDTSRIDSTCLLETEMVFIFEKSSSSSSSLLSYNGNTFVEQQCLNRNISSTLPRHKQVIGTEELIAINIEDYVQRRSGKTSSSFTLNVTGNIESRDKWKRGRLVFDEGNEGGNGGRLCFSDSCGGWKGLVSFENQYGWDKLLSIKLGFAWNNCKENLGLNADKFSRYSVRDPVIKVWNSIPKDSGSSINISRSMVLSFTYSVDNIVRLWDLQMAKCLNETKINHGMVLERQSQGNLDSLFSSLGTRDGKAFVLIWDPRSFVKPLSFRLGNRQRFHSLQLIDKKICVLDGLNNTLFDLRMPGGSPIEVTPAMLRMKTPSSSFAKAETAREIPNISSEDIQFNDDDEACYCDFHRPQDSRKTYQFPSLLSRLTFPLAHPEE